jgi:hypothetical protein
LQDGRCCCWVRALLLLLVVQQQHCYCWVEQGIAAYWLLLLMVVLLTVQHCCRCWVVAVVHPGLLLQVRCLCLALVCLELPLLQLTPQSAAFTNRT